ncbi:MAG: glycosyltransferase [Promethearchaeota archaeon]
MKKIKVLYIITGLGPGGAEFTIQKILSKLDKNVFEVIVISLRDVRDLANTMRKHTNKIYILNFGKYSNFFGEFIKLRRIIKQEKPDILHCFMIHSNLVGRLFAINNNYKVISSVRTQLRNRFPLNLLDLLSQGLVNVYMVNSSAVRNFVEGYGLPREKIVLIENGVDFNNYTLEQVGIDDLKNELNLKNLPTITMIANLKKGKDYPTFIQSLSLLQKEMEFNALIVGRGMHFDDQTIVLKELTRGLNLENIHFLGFRKDIPKILSITDIWVSTTLFEGQSNSLLEAMAMKKKIITTDIPENSEVVRHEKEALLIPIKNPKELTKAIKRLIQEKEFASNLADNAYKRAYEKYNSDIMVKKIEKLYSFLVKIV